LSEFIPYGRQSISPSDLEAVKNVLDSDWLTTGPEVKYFEEEFAKFCNTPYATSFSNGTGALHALMASLGFTEGDEVIVPAITFAATANAVLYTGGKPVFSDVEPDTLLMDINHTEKLLTPQSKAIVLVDYAGQPSDYDEFRKLAKKHGLSLIVDACHSVGATYKTRRAGEGLDLAAFSFHPVKPMTSGEGGMVITSEKSLDKKLKRFRNHGINQDFKEREKNQTYEYDITEIGFNYRLTDIQAALGRSQLKRLDQMTQKRKKIASFYNEALQQVTELSPLTLKPDRTHSHHLYVVQLNKTFHKEDRDQLFNFLKSKGIGVNVHYKPVYLHTLYQKKGYLTGSCPVAESAYERILSLPIYPDLKEDQVIRVINTLKEGLTQLKK